MPCGEVFTVRTGDSNADMFSQLDRIEAMLIQLTAKKKPVKNRSSAGPVYNHHFETVWGAYPSRSGGNPKRKACHAWKKRMEDATADELDIMLAGTKRYAAYCEVMVEDKRFVMQAATFFGPDKHYENDWTIPVKTDSVPRSNDELVDWASGKGFRNPAPGESFNDYRKVVEQLYRSST